MAGRQPKAPAAFTHRRNPRHSLSEAESTSGYMVLSGEPRKKSPVTPPGIDRGTVRLVTQCLNHYATPGEYGIYHAENVLKLYKITYVYIVTESIQTLYSMQ